MSGKTNRLTAPSARIAAIAYDASSSSASIAPFAAMIADTPQTADPMAEQADQLRAQLEGATEHGHDRDGHDELPAPRTRG
jgi:hypothetical protein